MTKRRKYHKPEQIIKKLREAETMLAAGKTLGQVYQALEVSEQTYERWQKKYGGMQAEEAKRSHELEVKNSRLKKMVADLSLDKNMLQDVLSKKL